MLKRGSGTLVFVASVAGKVPVPLEAPYAATKAALLAFGEALRYEVEDDGVAVLCVCPGVIDTPFFGEQDLAVMPNVAKRGMVPVEGLVESVMKALARGRRELTFPASIATAYPVKALAPGLTPRAVLEKFAALQMVDVHLPTTDGRYLVLPRYTQPDKDQQILLSQLKLELPDQPPPKIYSQALAANA